MLTANARRLFPLLDPTVGRAVGAYFQYQKNQGQAESLKMTGTLDDGDPATPDAVNLSFQRDPEGTVQVQGTYAGQEVQVRIAQEERTALREKENLIWGQAGVSEQKNQAVMKGNVGEYPVAGHVTTYRKEVDIEMTPELSKAGKAIYVLPFALSVTPTFGGAPAKVNGLPGDVPTASTPLETTDRTNVQAKIGDLAVNTEQNWTTTTWTVSTNLRAGGSRVTMMQHERASETEKYQSGQEVKQESRQFEVESGKGALSQARTYELDFKGGEVFGNLTAQEARLNFQLRPN
jgi:hypothetical protein